jgi:hypothetical protein
MKKWFYYVAIFTIFLGFGSIFLILFWLLYPYNILVFKEGNGTVLNTQVKNGGYLQILQIRCKNIAIPGVIDRQFIDGIVYQVPTFTTNRSIGCTNTIEYVYVPKALPEGTYHIDNTITYKPNPIRTVIYTVRTNNFTVIK